MGELPVPELQDNKVTFKTFKTWSPSLGMLKLLTVSCFVIWFHSESLKMASPASENFPALQDLEGLEPLASFECTTGTLLWGQLDTVMEAKLKLDDNMFDGEAAHAKRGKSPLNLADFFCGRDVL